MTQIQSQPLGFRLHKSLKARLAVVIALCLVLITTLSAFADTVRISDPNHTLNASRVQSEGQNLPDPLDVYVVSSFGGTQSQFNQRLHSHIDSSRKIVMVIDTGNKYFAVAGGTSVPLSNSQYSSAVSAFKNNFNNGDYTGATIAAIQSLESSLGSSGNPISRGAGGIFSGLLGTLCCVGLIILVILGVVFFVGRRMFGFGGRRRGVPYQQPYQQPYNQGYPPNYGPGYNQGSGINPLAAGGLGAAAGGLIGYELGKEQGEDQAREQGGNWGGDGGDYGGGAGGSFGGGDFGGGAGGDFGGGGGGGDFGGGAGGDFGGGGGGDFGGGGGGGDFGGGGGNF